MIVTVIKGGLGNQLFQYATGLALAKKLKTKLVLDKSFYSISKNRSFELKNFKNIKNKSIDWSIRSKKFKLLFPLNRKFKSLSDQSLALNSTFESIQGNVELDGYWHNTKYFKDIVDELKTIFQFKLTNSQAKALKNDIIKDESISIHIRQGDYINNERYNNLPIEYYTEAIDYLIERSNIKRPKLYVFSDDIEYSNKFLEEIKIEKHFVQNQSAIEDMELMKYCKYHIIANSTFSWWGAFLKEKSNLLTIAPKKWFTDDTNNEYISSLIPADWVKIAP